MSYKKFASRVTVLILVNLLVKLIWIFFIERKVQLAVGFESFGVYYSIFNFTLILGVINDPGLNNYLIQKLSKGRATKSDLSELSYLKIYLTVLYVALTLGLSLLLNFNNYRLIGLLVLYQILFSLLNYFRGFLKGHQLLKTEIYFSVLDKAILILAFLPVLYYQTNFIWTIQFYVIGQMVAVLLSLAFCYYLLQRKKITVFATENFALKSSAIKKIAPFALFAFLVLAYNKIDTVMLAQTLPDGNLQTGIYAAAYRFLDAASMLPILFATLFYPVICKLLADGESTDGLVTTSLSTLLPITLIMATVSWFYREQLMHLFYGLQNTEELSLVFGLLMFCLPMVVIYYVFSSFFTANNNLKLLNLVSAGGLAINVILNIFLIPKYGALGTSISSLASFFVIALTYIALYYVYFDNSFKIILWFKILAFTLLLAVFGYLADHLNFDWRLKFLIYSTLSAILALLFKFFDLKIVRTFIGLKP